MFPANQSSSPSSVVHPSAEVPTYADKVRAAREGIPQIVIKPAEPRLQNLTATKVAKKFLGADLHQPDELGSYLLSITPLADPLFFQNRAHQCLLFQTKLGEATVYSMAETGATTNFHFAHLVEQIGLEIHPQ